MKRHGPPLFFAAATLLAFYKVVFHADFTLLSGGDMAAAYFPWFDAASHWLRKGIVMLWDPYVYAGKLTMGEPQPGLFYPLNWLVMLLPSRTGGVSLDGLQALLVLDFFLAGLLFYKLARSFEQSPHAAALSGITFAFGGYTVQLYGYVNVLSGFVWLPLGLLCFRNALLGETAKSRVRWTLGGGGALALAFLAGHHIPPVHAGLLLLFYAAWVTARDWRSSGWAKRLLPWIVLAGVAISSLVWTAFQWLPSAEWARQVYRWVGGGEPVKWGQKVPYSVLQDSSYISPQDAISLVLPYVSTNANMYVGGVVLFFALAGLLFARRRDAGFFAAGAFCYFLLSWGRFSALHGWLNTFIPGIWFAREVFYYLIPFQACLALLAGWGLDALLKGCEEPDRAPGLSAFLRRSAACMALLALGAGAFGAIWHLDRGLPMNHPYVAGVACLAAFMGILGLLLFLLRARRLGAAPFRNIIVLLVLVDLASHLSVDIRPKNPPEGQENTYVRHYWKKPRTAEYLLELRRQDYFRVDDPLNSYPPNYGDAWRLEATMGHGATALLDYFSFRGTGWGPGSNASALLNAKYFVSRLPVPWAEKVLEDRETIYRNPRALARAFVAERYRSFSRTEEVLSWLQSPLFAPGETVLLPEAELARLAPALRGALEIEKESGTVRIKSRTTASENAYKSVADPTARHQLFVLGAPWGWSAGDEATMEILPQPGAGEWFLALNYYPGAAASTLLPVRIEGNGTARDIIVELTGMPGDGGSLQRQTVRLGDLHSQRCTVAIRVPEGAGARLDSFRITTGRGTPGRSAGEASITSHKPNRVRLQARLERTAFVVLSEVHYPGWEALLDGRPVPLLRANGILRAVAVPAGIHDIEVRFRSRTLQWGVAVALLGLLAAAAIWRSTRP